MTACNRAPVEGRAIQGQHVGGTLTGGAGAHIGQLAAQDVVGAVGEHQDGDIEVLARHRPQRLHGVHRAAVALERDDLAVRAGDGGADGRRQGEADRPAHQGHPVVWRRMGGQGGETAPGRDRFVDHDGVLRQQRAQHRGNAFLGQFAGGQTRGIQARQVRRRERASAEFRSQRLESAFDVLLYAGQAREGARRRRLQAGFAGIGEKAHRRPGAGQHDRAEITQGL